MFVEFESGFGNDRGTGFEVQYSEIDDPPTDVGDASTTVTTKPTDEQTDEQTDKPSGKPTFKQAEPPTSNYYFILIFMLSHGPNKTKLTSPQSYFRYLHVYISVFKNVAI